MRKFILAAVVATALALEKAKIQLEIAKACGNNPNCHMVMGADGTIITTG